MLMPAPRQLVREVVARQLPRLDDHLDRQGRSLSSWQRRSLARLATCCDPVEGFALLRCPDCDRHRIVPFTCGVRGVCGTCAGRSMSSRAARWVDGLFPHGVPVRQGVLTVPWPRRFLLARWPDLTREVIRVVLGVLLSWYAERGEAVAGRRARSGAVTVIQRFSSSLSLNVHLHILAIDAACVEEPDGTVRWHRVPPPRTEEVRAVAAAIFVAVEALLGRRGFPADDAEELDDDDLTPLLDAAAGGRTALGLRAGRRTRSQRLLPGRAWRRPPRCAEVGGYNLHANVVVLRRDALERLCRYVNRPVLARSRLTRREDGLLQLTLRRPWANGDHLVPVLRAGAGRASDGVAAPTPGESGLLPWRAGAPLQAPCSRGPGPGARAVPRGAAYPRSPASDRPLDAMGRPSLSRVRTRRLRLPVRGNAGAPRRRAAPGHHRRPREPPALGSGPSVVPEVLAPPATRAPPTASHPPVLTRPSCRRGLVRAAHPIRGCTPRGSSVPRVASGASPATRCCSDSREGGTRTNDGCPPRRGVLPGPPKKLTCPEIRLVSGISANRLV